MKPHIGSLGAILRSKYYVLFGNALSYSLSNSDHRHHRSRLKSEIRLATLTTPSSLDAVAHTSFLEMMEAKANDRGHPNHLIIVCGHAIWNGGPTNGKDESEWVIEDWKKGETPTYVEHIKAGLKVLNKDDRAILVFSG